jgi:hypothetical protein
MNVELRWLTRPTQECYRTILESGEQADVPIPERVLQYRRQFSEMYGGGWDEWRDVPEMDA